MCTREDTLRLEMARSLGAAVVVDVDELDLSSVVVEETTTHRGIM
jgi:hypothetical protein